MLPKWDSSFSVHNAKIDAQHQKLFELAARVEQISDKPVSKSEVKELLADFFNYMKDHFSDEEKYMDMIKYPGLERHKVIHKEIIQLMINLIKDIKSTNDLKEKLYTVAKQWLLGHILQEDMKVEKWRSSQLTSDDGDVSFEEEVCSLDGSTDIYLYTCKCAGKLHDVPYTVHQKIQSGNKFTCRACKSVLKFHNKLS